jgi:hypothetical protein
MAAKGVTRDLRLPVTETFRELVREQIGDRAWKPIAEKAGMSEMALIRIAGDPKDGKRSASSDRLVRLCEVLDIPLFECFPLEDEQRKVLRALKHVADNNGDDEAFADEIAVMSQWKVARPPSAPTPQVIDVSPAYVTPRRRP